MAPCTNIKILFLNRRKIFMKASVQPMNLNCQRMAVACAEHSALNIGR